MRAKLVVVQPQGAEPSEYDIALPVRLGRGREAGLQLAYALVSREHCELFEDRGRIFVRDLGSRNGTFVGGQRVQTAPLPPGELLTVGSVTLRAIYGEEVFVAPSQIVTGERAEGLETVPIQETAQASYKPRKEEPAESLGFGEDERSRFLKPSDN
jgi:pSer/pThr/pTyr-binding forkhead associated (FHA) protein